MAQPHIHLDPASLSPVEEKLRGPLEDQLTSALQAATDKVGAHYSGESVDEVADQLVEQTKAGLHRDIAAGFEPDPGQMRQVAEAVITEH